MCSSAWRVSTPVPGPSSTITRASRTSPHSRVRRVRKRELGITEPTSRGFLKKPLKNSSELFAAPARRVVRAFIEGCSSAVFGGRARFYRTRLAGSTLSGLIFGGRRPTFRGCHDQSTDAAEYVARGAVRGVAVSRRHGDGEAL